MVRCWHVLEANSSDDAMKLKAQYRDTIDQGAFGPRPSSRSGLRSPRGGLLFATLPTEQSTGLPFHIDADFYPASDRKSIEFGDAHDPRSEWNRAAIRAAASAVQSNLIPLRDMYSDDASTLWAFLSCIHDVHQGAKGNIRLPLGEFWESLLPWSGRCSDCIHRIRQVALAEATLEFPPGPQEEDAVRAFQDIGIEIVHRDLWRNSRNLLTRREVGVRRVSAS